jgi:S-adenosylmethionine:tRNA ribosyltransferase-isomerase
VTLHVGAGTFQPVRVDDDLASTACTARLSRVGATLVERSPRRAPRGGRVIAVGTTSLRALESAARPWASWPFAGETRLFILPGLRFRWSMRCSPTSTCPNPPC